MKTQFHFVAYNTTHTRVSQFSLVAVMYVLLDIQHYTEGGWRERSDFYLPRNRVSHLKWRNKTFQYFYKCEKSTGQFWEFPPANL